MDGKKILIVEDECLVALHMESTLQGLGYTVAGIASSGEDAIRKAEEMRPDLVLMDIILKGDMDGIEAADRMRSRFDIPVIFVTAYGAESTLQRAKITEPFGYLLKPFKERELHIAIQIALYKHDSEKQLRKAQRWIATILRSIGDAVIATDVEGRVTYMNPVAEKLSGIGVADALGKKLMAVLNIKDLDGDEAALIDDRIVNSVIKEGMPINLIEDRLIVLPAGKEIQISDSAAPLRDENGTIPGMVLVFRDIAASKKG